MVLQDLYVQLKDPQLQGTNSKIISINLQNRVNFSQYELLNNFEFDSGAIASVNLDRVPGRILVTILNERKLNFPDFDGVYLKYNASGINNGNLLSGRIVFSNLDFNIVAAPINVELDACCTLPDSIIIDPVQENGGQNGYVSDIETIDTDAGTFEIIEVTGNNYNEDFNDDFGMDPRTKIKFTFNKDSGFWRVFPALVTTKYTWNRLNKTAQNNITITLKK